MADNIYFLYFLVMLFIVALGASMIAGISYLLSVAKHFIHRDWKYRLRVLLALATSGAVMLAIIIHWLITPDS